MKDRFLFTSLLLFALIGFNEGAVLAQGAKLDELASFLKEKQVRPEAIPPIIQHLNESGGVDYLDELVTWAKAGFPELHDENGIWKTESTSFKLGVVHSIHYFVDELPSSLKSQKYLEILDELRKSEFVSFHLSTMASLFVDEESLKRRAFELMRARDLEERARGAVMICGLASSDESVTERCRKKLLRDKSSKVRNTVLYSLPSLNGAKADLQKSVTSLYLDALIYDPTRYVRENAGEHLLSCANAGTLIGNGGLPGILVLLVGTKDKMVREVLGRVAARLTTDRSLGIDEDKITSTLLRGFVSKVKSKESRVRGEIDKQVIVKMWLNFWTPLRPKFSKQYEAVP